MKPPTAAPTPVLKQSQATYVCVGRIVRSRASSYSNAFAEWTIRIQTRSCMHISIQNFNIYYDRQYIAINKMYIICDQEYIITYLTR